MSDRLRETRQAFDSVAADYDGQRGNNELIQDMRSEMWRWLDVTFAAHSRLIDIGCGTGLDAIRMAQLGHRITAIDWSPQMVHRTAERASQAGVTESVETLAIGAQELSRLEGSALYDGAYSNLGPLNCVPGLDEVSRQCGRLLKPGAALVFTVIGRVCPWEMVHYMLKGRWARARIRYAPDFVAVGMNKRTIWTHYYQPREFYRYFQREFELQEYRGLCTFAPPPYLTWMRDKHPRWHERLWRLDRRMSGLPLLRDVGDHFLMIMKRRA
jgi:2-polyprenyl-3-methyl-5-hydroxy-6-metoxy-1,4-benzoquinol methylase